MRLLVFAVLAACVARAADAPGPPDAPVAFPAGAPPPAAAADSGELVALGELLFFDETISAEGNQSCADCHGRDAGWTGPDRALNQGGAVYKGSVAPRYGNRKPTTVAYAGWSPVLHIEARAGFKGGNFWDGRATGEQFGDPSIDQAQGPPLNPLEQALPDAAAVMERVCAAPYADRFRAAWGEAACDDADAGFEAFARTIALFEASDRVSPFSSKFDAVRAGRATFTRKEARGLGLFRGKANCTSCHVMEATDTATPALFTDFTYDNIGLPRNPANPFYGQTEFNPDGEAWIDPGLGGFLATRPEWADRAEAYRGKHKVPTLRNVAERPSPDFVKAFGHNGYFKSLEEVVHFYNTRDALPQCMSGSPGEKRTCWPASEVPDTVNKEVGALGLTLPEERAIVAFLGTLTDGWEAGTP